MDIVADDRAEGQEHRTWKILISWISEFRGLVDAREFNFWSAAKSFFSQMTGSEQAKGKEEAAAIMRAKQLAGTSPFPFLYLCLFLLLSTERRGGAALQIRSEVATRGQC